MNSVQSLWRRVLASGFSRLSPDSREHVARLVERNYEAIAYKRLCDFGFRPGAIVDVGAFRGDWTRLARATFGELPALMVEAQAPLIPALETYAASRAGLHCEHAVLASKAGLDVTFHEMGTGSSIFAEASNAPRSSTKMISRTLDDVVGAALPDDQDIFLKIDVQGAELEVLGGGLDVLRRCALVQLEVALLPYNEGAPMIADVIAWMKQQGWMATELSGFSRPRDRLVQIDMLFAPADSSLRPRYFEF
jgi:FkbM family methyltransferase